jgi:hypothetical protein
MNQIARAWLELIWIKFILERNHYAFKFIGLDRGYFHESAISHSRFTHRFLPPGKDGSLPGR